MFLDTSGLLGLAERSEPCHAAAVELYAGARRRLTHSYVLSELVALANARGLPRPPILTFLMDMHADGDVETIWVDEKLHLDAIELLASRADKTYSLCDAVSFLLVRRRRIWEALASDRHFEQEGFRRLLATP